MCLRGQNTYIASTRSSVQISVHQRRNFFEKKKGNCYEFSNPMWRPMDFDSNKPSVKLLFVTFEEN
jgi:hypothetical protein